MTSLAYIFTMEKPYSRLFLAVNVLFVNRLSILCGTFYDFWDAIG